MAPRIPPEAELTELAKHYGEQPDLQALKGTKKSGITPVDPLPPAGPALSREDWRIRKLIEATQKEILVGFTAREIKAMGAFAYFESPVASKLSNPIHPVFHRWESSDAAMMRRHNPMIPLGAGREGFWEASNPLVEEALVPCLRLATQFMNGPHMWSWWDTMCFGELVPLLPERRSKDGAVLYSVRPRNPVVVHEESERTRERFIEIASRLTWGLAAAMCDPLTGGSETIANGWQGVTLTDPFTGIIRCYLSIDKMEQLLRPDLLDAERLLLQFSVAKTAVHELAHAVWRLNKRWEAGSTWRNIRPEPYFIDEVTSELGHSWINHLLGGREVAITNAGYGIKERQFIANCMVPYPNWRDIGKRLPVLSKVESMSQDDYFPIPIEYFERVQQDDFWNYHVKVFGPHSVHMGPLIHGRRHRSSDLPHVPKTDYQEIIITEDADERDVAAFNIENSKMANAVKVWRALEASVAAEQSHDVEQINELLQSNDFQQSGEFDSMVEAVVEGLDVTPISWADYLADGLRIDEEPEDTSEPARFLEIAEFLVGHRRVLAIDTMVWPIPELTFLGYVNRIGKISITRDEFRAFLIHANFRDTLFNWNKVGIGMLWRNNNGWGLVTLAPLRNFTEPRAEHLRLMEKHMAENWDIYTERILRDLDENLAFYFFNSSMSSELTKAEYDNLIDYYDHKKKWWVHGPLGIVRCIGGVPASVAAERRKRREEKASKNAASQSSETPTEKEKKKKKIEKKKQKQKQKQEAEKRKQEEEKRKQEEEAQKRTRTALAWNRAVKRVREQEDPPEEPVAKRRKTITVLEAVSNQEKAALTETGGDEGAGDPMEWSANYS